MKNNNEEVTKCIGPSDSIPTKRVSMRPIHCAMFDVNRNVRTLPMPMDDTAIPKARASLSRNQKAITRSRTTEKGTTQISGKLIWCGYLLIIKGNFTQFSIFYEDLWKVSLNCL